MAVVLFCSGGRLSFLNRKEMEKGEEETRDKIGKYI